MLPPPPSGELAVSDEAKSLRGRVRRSVLVVTVFACSLLFGPFWAMVGLGLQLGRAGSYVSGSAHSYRVHTVAQS